jgi:hypothetical protein
MSAISLTNIPSSTTPSTPETFWQKYVEKRQPELKKLDEALKSGDLTAAKQDYNDLVALGNNVLHKDNPFLRRDRALDFDAIGGALQNGDLAGAQKAVGALESTFQQKQVPPADKLPSPTSATAVSSGGINVVA